MLVGSRWQIYFKLLIIVIEIFYIFLNKIIIIDILKNQFTTKWQNGRVVTCEAQIKKEENGRSIQKKVVGAIY